MPTYPSESPWLDPEFDLFGIGGAGIVPLSNWEFNPESVSRGAFPVRDGGSEQGGGGIGSPDVFAGDAQAGVNQGLSGLGGMFPLLGDSEAMDSLGPLFRTLLALQTGQKSGTDQIFSLFSGIQL